MDKDLDRERSRVKWAFIVCENEVIGAGVVAGVVVGWTSTVAWRMGLRLAELIIGLTTSRIGDWH